MNVNTVYCVFEVFHVISVLALLYAVYLQIKEDRRLMDKSSTNSPISQSNDHAPDPEKLVRTTDAIKVKGTQRILTNRIIDDEDMQYD